MVRKTSYLPPPNFWSAGTKFRPRYKPQKIKNAHIGTLKKFHMYLIKKFYFPLKSQYYMKTSIVVHAVTVGISRNKNNHIIRNKNFRPFAKYASLRFFGGSGSRRSVCVTFFVSVWKTKTYESVSSVSNSVISGYHRTL